MPTLAFDTSTATGVVALLADDGRLAQRTGPAETKHGETLIPMIQQVLQELSVAVEDLSLVAVGTGPGSFTGLRVGLATARGLGLARAVPVGGVSSLLAMATRAIESEGGDAIAAIVDAFRGEVYVALYTRAGGGLEQRLPPFNALPADAARALATAVPGGPIAVVGDGLGKYAAEFADVLADRIRRLPAALDVVCPVTLGRLAEARVAAGGVESLDPPQPAYLRGADAKLPDVPLKL